MWYFYNSNKYFIKHSIAKNGYDSGRVNLNVVPLPN